VLFQPKGYILMTNYVQQLDIAPKRLIFIQNAAPNLRGRRFQKPGYASLP
jgi:hypothetical protein